MSLLTEGLVKVITASIPTLTFKGVGAAEHAGIPFIRSVNASNMLSVSGINSDNVIKTYAINGNTGKVASKKLVSASKTRAYLPVITNGYAVGPWGAKGYLYVENLNNFLGAGNVIRYRKGTSIKSGDAQLPTNHKLLGLVLNSAQTMAMAITAETTADPSLGGSFTGCFYWIMNVKGTIVDSGIVDGAVSIYTFGFGRSSQLDYTASVLEVKNPYLWAVQGGGTGKVSLYNYGGGVLTLVDSIDDDAGLTDSSYFPANPSVIVRSGLLLVVAGDIVYKYKRQSIEGVGYDDSKSWLGEIVRTESYYSGLINDFQFNNSFKAGQYKETRLVISSNLADKSLFGFMTTGGAIRTNFESLRAIGFFDLVPRGYSIAFRGRGNQSPINVVTYDGTNYTEQSKIPFAHIGAFEGSTPPKSSMEHNFEMESQLPRKVEIKFQDVFRNFDTNLVESVSEDSRVQTTESVNSPVVMAYNTANQLAQTIRKMRWFERNSFNFTLPPIYCTLEPGDVVMLELPFDVGFLVLPVRITTVNYKANGLIGVEAKATNGAVYALDESDLTPKPDEEDPNASESSFVELLDIPPVTVLLETFTAYLAVGTGLVDPWGGCSVVRSDDEGQTFINIVDFTVPCVIGNCKTVAEPSEGVLIDRGTQLTIDMVSGELNAISDTDFQFNKNLAAWGSPDTGWEIVKFRDAVLNPDGTYTISHLMRGLFGTEWRTGDHEVDELFILLDTNIKTVFSTTSALNVEKVYKYIDVGDDIESVPEDTFTYTGANLKPFTVCHPAARRSLTSATSVSWVRRSRFDNGWRDGVDVPLNEYSERYEVDILDSPGGAVLRTIVPNIGVSNILYYDAHQHTDFGSVQTTLHVVIYQTSATVGRGFPLAVSLEVLPNV